MICYRVFFSIVACAAMFCLGSQAQASLTIVSSVGGVPLSGANYVTFDASSIVAGVASNTASSADPLGSIGVSFAPDAQLATGSVSGIYAAPFLSNNSGLVFDGQSNGVDSTQYITSGKDGVSNPGAAATLTFSGLQGYFGLLWGSVDLYNTLEFYNGNTLVGSITGGQVNPLATGDQGINGTYYVNITSTLGFDKVVAKSSEYAFEFDNVSYSRLAVPEPGSIAIWSVFAGLGLIGVRRRKFNRS